MFYNFRVNLALSQIGVSPNLINIDYRIATKAIGKAAGYTPQEVAVCIASRLPVIYQVSIRMDIIRGWAELGRLRPKIDDVYGALGDLALWDLMARN